MKISIGCDHAAVDLKNTVKKYLCDNGYEVLDEGTNTTERVDYPDIAQKVCLDIRKGKCEKGILLCGSGIGMSIAANKFDGIRAAHCTDPLSGRLAKEHNNANVLCLGARITGSDLVLEIVKAYLGAEFQKGRHEERVNKIAMLEKNH